MAFRKVLHIDDDEDDLDFFSTSVLQLDPDIECISLSSATEALDKITAMELAPDIIFLDLNMPVMTGFQFLEEIQKFPLESVPIVVLSTCSLRETVDKVLESGGTAYLTKPNSTKELIQLIKPFLK